MEILQEVEVLIQQALVCSFGRSVNEDPWLVQLHDFISDEEAAAFLKRCDSHFERSLAGG
eukprot:4653778-Pleurochrysis_carterae.AAC.2